jgi:hypothetical protein
VPSLVVCFAGGSAAAGWFSKESWSKRGTDAWSVVTASLSKLFTDVWTYLYRSVLAVAAFLFVYFGIGGMLTVVREWFIKVSAAG